MKTWRSVRQPAAIARLPKDDRGFPITFVALIVDGKPDFTTIDAQKILACIERRLCGMCGERIMSTDRVGFIGGPLSIENRNFLDPWMHLWCARYAMQVCPHIVHDNSRYKKQDLSDGVRSQMEFASDERPDLFGLLDVQPSDIAITNYMGQPVFLVHPTAHANVHWQDTITT